MSTPAPKRVPSANSGLETGAVFLDGQLVHSEKLVNDTQTFAHHLHGRACVAGCRCAATEKEQSGSIEIRDTIDRLREHLQDP